MGKLDFFNPKRVNSENEKTHQLGLKTGEPVIEIKEEDLNGEERKKITQFGRINKPEDGTPEVKG